jgi:hypothetical protein
MLSERIKSYSPYYDDVPRYQTRFAGSLHMTIHPIHLEYLYCPNKCLMTSRFPYQNRNGDKQLTLMY